MKHVVKNPNSPALSGVRKTSDLFGSAPMAEYREAPSGWVENPEDLARYLQPWARWSLTGEEEPALREQGGGSPEQGTVAYAARRGWLAASYMDIRYSVVRRDAEALVPPAILDLSSWGLRTRYRGRDVYVPAPAEFRALLAGDSIALPDEAKGLEVAIPSLRSYSAAEFEFLHGSAFTRALNAIVDGARDAKGLAPRALVSGAEREEQFYRDYDLCLGLAGQDDRVSLVNLDGLEQSFGREAWMKLLPGLERAWAVRAAVAGEPVIRDSVDGLETSVYAPSMPGGFGFRGAWFGFSCVVVEPSAITERVDRLELGLGLVEKGSWTPEELAFFLRALDYTLLEPLRVSKGGTYRRVAEVIAGADQGSLVRPETFFSLVPGGAPGFCQWLRDLYRAAGRVVLAGRFEPARELPAEVCFELSGQVSKEGRQWERRSFGTARANPVLQQAPVDGVRFSAGPGGFVRVWRAISAPSVKWPPQPYFDYERGQALKWGRFGEYIASLPARDAVLESLASACLKTDPKGEVPCALAESLSAYVDFFQAEFTWGYGTRPDRFVLEGLVLGEPLPETELPKMLPMLKAGEVDYDLSKALGRWLAAFDGGDLIQYPRWSPLSEAREEVYDLPRAEEEVWRWLTRHPKLAESIAPYDWSKDAHGRLEHLEKVLDGMRAANESLQADAPDALVKLEAAHAPLARLLRDAPWLVFGHPEAGALHPERLRSLFSLAVYHPDGPSTAALMKSVKAAVKAFCEPGKDWSAAYAHAFGVRLRVMGTAKAFAGKPLFPGIAVDVPRVAGGLKPARPKVYGLGAFYFQFLAKHGPEKVWAGRHNVCLPDFAAVSGGLDFAGVRDFVLVGGERSSSLVMRALVDDPRLRPAGGPVEVAPPSPEAALTIAPGVPAPEWARTGSREADNPGDFALGPEPVGEELEVEV